MVKILKTRPAVYSGDVDHRSGHRDQIPVMLTTRS